MTCECAHPRQHHRTGDAMTCRVAGCGCDGYLDAEDAAPAASKDCACGHDAILHREYGRGPCIEQACGCAGRQQAYYEERRDEAYERYKARGGARSLRRKPRPARRGDISVAAHERSNGARVRAHTRRRNSR